MLADQAAAAALTKQQQQQQQQQHRQRQQPPTSWMSALMGEGPATAPMSQPNQLLGNLQVPELTERLQRMEGYGAGAGEGVKGQHRR